ILNHNNWEFWWGWDENESFERRWSFGDGEILIYAEATWDPVDPEEMERKNWQIQDQEEWRDFDWNRDVSWTAASNVITLQVTSPQGAMTVPTFTLAKNSLTWGENLTVNVTDTVPKDASGNVLSEGWFYGNLYQKMYDENGEEHWEGANRGNDIRIYSGTNLIPTYALDENGGKFAVEIGADAEGYSGRSARLEFSLGKKPQSVSGKFTANGKTGTVNVPTGKEIILSAYHPQAEWYDVEITKAGDEEWYENRSGGDGMLYDTWCANEAGKYTLTAYACANGDPDEIRAEIGTIQINATAANGPLAPLDVRMKDLAQVGDLLEITFNAPANAEEYSYWVHRPDDGQWLAGASRHTPGTLNLNTALLDSGVYCVDLEARAAGYETSHSRLHFALLDENDTNLSKNDENEEPVYYFTISERQLKTQEGTHIVAYVPGADYVELLVQKMGENGQPSGSLEPYEHRSGPGLDTWYGSGEAGTYSIWLKYGDNMPEQVTTLTITAEGNLTHPVISVNGQPSGTTVPANSGDSLHTLNISIPKVANAESYFIRLSRMDWDGWLYEKGFLTSEFGENTIELPIEHEGIEPGRMLRIECFAHARNYNSASSSWTFLLQESQTSSFTLQVEQKEQYWTAEDVYVTASCPGATAIRVFMNNENRWYRGSELPEDERFTIWDQDTLFYAYATTDLIPEDDNFDLDKLNWSMASNVVPIYAETNGPTLVPTLTFNSHVKKGEWFEFEIEGDGDARQMDIRIRDEDGNIMEFRRLWEIGTYQLPTANLTVGERYWVSLSCVQDRHLWNEGPSQILRVDPPEQDQKFFEMNKTEVYRYEPFIPTVYAPGAERVKITLGGGEWGSWDGDSGTNDADWEWFLEDTGTHTFHAYALYNEADGWTEIDTVTMTVKESDPLDLADIQVENVIDVTEECQIRIPLVSGGANYIVEVHYQGQENDWIRMEKWPQEADANHELVFTIEANTLIPDRAYWIDCNIGEEDRDYGHCASYTSKGVMTVDGSNLDRNITLSVNKISAPVNTPVEITVSMASSYDQIPSAVAVYMGDQVRYCFFDDSGVTVDMGDYQPLPETIFARAYYGHDLPEDWDDVDWDSLAWGHATAYVQVTFTSSGNADPATIGQYNGAVMVGSKEEIVVHITLGNHANEAHAN
ncbi:MAG: hypothetical protein K5922_03505, partial [Clostridiales bacterium]|nr:hypothetical protein [Clostridiales bacterium]